MFDVLFQSLVTHTFYKEVHEGCIALKRNLPVYSENANIVIRRAFAIFMWQRKKLLGNVLKILGG